MLLNSIPDKPVKHLQIYSTTTSRGVTNESKHIKYINKMTIIFVVVMTIFISSMNKKYLFLDQIFTGTFCEQVCLWN